MPDFARSKTVNEQYKESIEHLRNQLAFFDYSYIIPELHESGVLHYHCLGSMKKENLAKYQQKMVYKPDSYLECEKETFHMLNLYDVIAVKYSRIKHTEIFSYTSPGLDIRPLDPSDDFVAYLHKDIDRLYRVCNGWETVKFVIISRYEAPLKGLHQLVSFKKYNS